MKFKITVGILSLALANWGFNGGAAHKTATHQRRGGDRKLLLWAGIVLSLSCDNISLSHSPTCTLFASLKSGLKCRPEQKRPRFLLISIGVGIAHCVREGEELAYSLTLGLFWKIQRCERRTKLLISMSFLLRIVWHHWKGHQIVVGNKVVWRTKFTVGRRGW